MIPNNCRLCHVSMTSNNILQCGKNRARGQYSTELDEKIAVKCRHFWPIPTRDEQGRIVGFPHRDFSTGPKVVIEKVDVKNERVVTKEVADETVSDS